MKKTALIVCLIAGLALVLPYLCNRASSQDESTATVPISFYSDVRDKLAKIAAQNDNLQVGVLQQKLDQILANQAQILQELNTIKLRATR